MLHLNHTLRHTTEDIYYSKFYKGHYFDYLLEKSKYICLDVIDVKVDILTQTIRFRARLSTIRVTITHNYTHESLN